MLPVLGFFGLSGAELVLSLSFSFTGSSQRGTARYARINSRRLNLVDI
ncbi:MAG: hypothetical protein J0I25_02090 [Sphingomonadales bacterium]|nr:hypothetical protein [Sphingomonadales bacterium]